jgi:hypothetical protein
VFGLKASSPKDLENLAPDHPEQIKKQNPQELAKTFLRNPFDSDKIDDKGKADSVSKALVSCQALWMLLQCISRKMNGVPVPLVEIHVAIHIVYAGFMYGC